MNEYLIKLRTFLRECKRVWTVTKKPTKLEFRTVVKVTALGSVVIGLIGFLIVIGGELVR